MSDLTYYVNKYRNDAVHNDWIHQTFTAETDRVPDLKDHRDYIEKHKLGFGDRAFHYMWYLVLTDLKSRGTKADLLEIGVYKGQVISLWALLAHKLGLSATISCISPMKGDLPKLYLLNNRVSNKLRALMSPKYRRAVAEGNVYEDDDYEAVVRDLFSRFGQSFDNVRSLKGFSNDTEVLERARTGTYDVIYIDGDHSYNGVIADITNYSPLIKDQGFLVMDDASFFLEGTVFWKGHEEVSRACERIPSLGFKNILNVGHNRIYRKI